MVDARIFQIDTVENALHDYEQYGGPKPWEEHFQLDRAPVADGPMMDPIALRRALALIVGRLEEGFSVEPSGSSVHLTSAAMMCYWMITSALFIRPAIAPMSDDEARQLEFLFARIVIIGKIGPGEDPELPF